MDSNTYVLHLILLKTHVWKYHGNSKTVTFLSSCFVVNWCTLHRVSALPTVYEDLTFAVWNDNPRRLR